MCDVVIKSHSWGVAKELMTVEFVPRVKLLQESYRLMEMKKLLRAYGIRDTNLLKDKQMIMVSYQDFRFLQRSQ